MKKLIIAAAVLAALMALLPPAAATADVNISTEPADGSVAHGGSLVLYCAASSAADGGTVKYQWYKAASTSSYGGLAVGSESSSGSFAADTSGVGQLYYYCAVNEYVGGALAATVNSRIATVNVTLNQPVITLQPQSVSAETGDTVTLSCVASSGNAGLGSTLTYKWFASQTASGSFSEQSDSASSSYKPDTSSAGTRYYRCMVTETANGLSSSVVSSVVSVTVTTPVPAPVITVQPSSVWDIVGAGQHTLSVTATGTGLSYQWYFVGSSGAATALTNGTLSSITYSGAATSALTLVYPNAAMTLRYKCIVTNAGGSVSSDTVTVKVALQDPASAPVISRQPSASEVYQGETLTLSVTAAASDGGTLSYQWYENTQATVYSGAPVAGAVNASFTVPSTEVGDMYYYCLVTNMLGGTTASTYSHVALVTVLPVFVTPSATPVGSITPSPSLTPEATPYPTPTPDAAAPVSPSPTATPQPASDNDGARFPWWIIPVALIALAAGGVSAWLLARDKRRWGVTDEDEDEAEAEARIVPPPAPQHNAPQHNAQPHTAPQRHSEQPGQASASPQEKPAAQEKKVEFIDLFSDDD